MRMRLFAVWLTVVAAVPASAQDDGIKGRFDCFLEAHERVELSFSVSGIVDRVYVGRGDAVERGQWLARLRSDVERVSIELAKARAEFARRKVTRSEELLADEFVSEFNVDEAVTELRVAELEQQQAEAGLRLRTLYSPLDGVVVDRSMSKGQFVTEEATITVMQIDPLNVEVVAPVEDFGTISEGMKARVYPREPIGGEYEAVVTVVDTVIDAASGTFGIRLELPNPDGDLPAGLKCGLDFLPAE